MKKLALAAGCLTALLALASCGVVPFDLALSVGAVRGLTLEGMTGPLDKYGSGDELADSVLIPDIAGPTGLDPQNGYLLHTWSGSRQLTYAAWDAGRAMLAKLDSEASIGSSSDLYPQVVLHSIKGGTRSLAAFQFAGDPARFRVVVADPATNQMGVSLDEDLRSHNLALFGVTGNAIGASVAPADDPARDTAYVLSREDGTQDYLEYGCDVAAGGLTGIAGLRGSVAYDLSWLLPTDLDRALYYFDPLANRSFACVWDSAAGRWRTFTWSGVTAGSGGELPAVDHRIDALLTSGNLFSSEGGTGRIYGSGGGLVATFDLEGMMFVEERFVSGVARVLFSRTLVLDNAPWFLVYSVPTSDLGTLAGK
jgi:hypothetical protein